MQRRAGRFVLSLLVLTATVACASDAPVAGESSPGRSSSSAAATDTSAPPSAPSDLDGCVTAADGRLLVHEGESTSARVAIIGDGAVGVVVSYEVSRNVCPWLPLVQPLVDAGYRVLLYDTISGKATDHVVDRAALLREEGVEQVVLVGGSLGGAASIVAATEIDPLVSAVVSLSGGGVDTAAAVLELAVPLLQIVSEEDAPFADIAGQNDAAATGSPDHRLVVLPGRLHGSNLFLGPDAATVLTQVVEFFDLHTG